MMNKSELPKSCTSCKAIKATMTANSQRYTMPPGDKAGWDVVEECQGYQLARDFSREWMVDNDPGTAVMRLGFTGSVKEAKRLGHMLYGHELVQAFICQETKNFQKKHNADEETILEMLMAEAHDKGWASSQMGRVRALATVLNHIKPKGKNSEADDLGNNLPTVNVYLSTANKPT